MELQRLASLLDGCARFLSCMLATSMLLQDEEVQAPGMRASFGALPVVVSYE